MNKLDQITEENVSYLLHMLHKYLWPSERAPPIPSSNLENADVLNTIMQCFEGISYFIKLFDYLRNHKII